MLRRVNLFEIFILVSAGQFATAQDILPPGTTVNFDRCTSSNPNLGCWDRGVVAKSTSVSGQVRYTVRNSAGTPFTIPNDSRWIRAVSPAATPIPDGSHTGLYPDSNEAPSNSRATVTKKNPPTTSASGSLDQPNTKRGEFQERYPAGSKVEFDRVEAQNPANGRWDEGVVVGRTPGGYMQIRGANGILYRVKDDSRWILPAGSPLPGPRHDYLNHPLPAATSTTESTAKGSGADGGGPLAGEWAVVQMDGKPTSGHSMTFNFAGSRWEQIFQGAAVSGTFATSGNTIKMRQEDGGEFGIFRFVVSGTQLELTGVGKAAGTRFLLRKAHR